MRSQSAWFYDAMNHYIPQKDGIAPATRTDSTIMRINTDKKYVKSGGYLYKLLNLSG